MNALEMKQMRQAMALDVIHAMVAEGFTFFSSVCLDSTEAVPRNANLRDEGDYDCEDRLFFHIPGKACLVAISVNQWDYSNHTNQKLYINADVFLEQADPGRYLDHGRIRTAAAQHDELMKKARECGFVKWEYPHTMWACDKEEYLHLPWIDEAEATVTGTTLWSYHHGSRSDNVVGRHVESGPDRFTGTTVDRIKDLATSIHKVLPFVKDGQISELSSWELTPRYEKCDELFFSRFNTRYFRKLVKKAH